ncbi:anhydro-N-acetylmuramic acid kinase [Defluviimonas sp. WL0002]|uniref:Anhydro-N-acetylmuramic acid kinase n=1 Tax=Albidovulum marisflavi TaxID=2984159 RepID=A0ABT2ZBS3_9RHOB|nr:anhydro-N-acetylmuramic acid kinase [Defluviimonas sp. WL0002]MCV2868554.1 anhydro-N-acetylmuramic acid kinase [Defluviimonas sp. WL0002]
MMKSGSIWALGAMSGTSLDGVDAALVLTDGHRIEAFGDTAYRPYSEDESIVIRAAFGQWPGGPGVSAAARVIEAAHAEVMASLAADAELVGFHGQTLAHDPGGRRTHQAGDGARLAELLNRPVAWDFRSADMHLGGQGAPLAPFFHFACARWMNARAPLVFLNLGGVGNLTWVDPTQPAPEVPGACLAFDTGPANAPVNDLMVMRLGLSYDSAGRIAADGKVDRGVIARFLDHPYFLKMPPKSLDRNDFHGLLDMVADLSDADAAATLTCAAAVAVGLAADHFPLPPERILVTGGGRHNVTLMAMLDDELDAPVSPVEEVGLDGDMLEAQAFAYLAVRVARGMPTSCPTTTGVGAAVGGGLINYPPAIEI